MASKSTTTTPRTRRRTVKKTDEQTEPVVDDPVAKDVSMPANDEDFGAGLSEEQSAERATSGGDVGDNGERRSGGGDGEADPNRRRRRRRRRRRPDGSPVDSPGPGPRTQQRRGGGGGGGGGRRGGRQSQGHGQQRDHARRQPSSSPTNEVVTGTIEGVLELHPKGYGFLRDPQKRLYVAGDRSVRLQLADRKALAARRGHRSAAKSGLAAADKGRG